VSSEDACVVALAYSIEAEALCVAVSSGEVLLLHGCSGGGQGSSEAEEVGAIEGGVAAMAWSPTGESLVLVSGLGRLLLLTTQVRLLHSKGKSVC
jgi:hypothetical protein